MPLFSLDRDLVFTPDERPTYLYGQFPDFYAMLRVGRGASRAELENAILDAGSQLLAANLARGAGERLRLLNAHLPLLRRALLVSPMRARYDVLLDYYQNAQNRSDTLPHAETAMHSEGADFLALLRAQEESAGHSMTRAPSPLRRLLRRSVRA